MSEYADNCCTLSKGTTLSAVNDVLYNTLRHFQRADALLAGGVSGLLHSWQASTNVIGRLCTDNAERWQAAIRQIQAPANLANLAEILRARASIWSGT